MKYTGGITVVTVGLILALAVPMSPPFLNLRIAGVVLFIAGVTAIAMPEWLHRRRRREQETSPPTAGPGPNGQWPFSGPRDIASPQGRENAGAQPGSGTGDDTEKAA